MKNKKRWKIIGIIVAILILANAGYYLVMNWQNFFPNKDASSGDVASLQTYNNSKIGFQIQYPASWIVKDSGDTVGVYPPAEEGTQVYFSVAERDDFKSLADVKKTLAPDVTLTPIQISNASGFEYSDSASYESIWLLYSNKVYLLRTYSSLFLGDVANQILATFKFTN